MSSTDKRIARQPWRVSLHGGHSGRYCDHAEGELRDFLEAAVQQGYDTFGVTEHAPRIKDRFLYREERKLGWDVAKLARDFESYAAAIAALAEEFAGRLTVLRGFEIEIVPSDRYVELMQGYREHYAFDYMVGSVHWVDEILIDGPRDEFYRAAGEQGGVEALAIRYYETVAEMVRALEPEVVGHLDVIRKHAPSWDSVSTADVCAAARETLEAIRDAKSIIDINTAGYRKGHPTPYPAPWLLAIARDMGIGFCFGDDSHSPEDVGAGLDEARRYLLEHDIEEVSTLRKHKNKLVQRRIKLPKT